MRFLLFIALTVGCGPESRGNSAVSDRQGGPGEGAGAAEGAEGTDDADEAPPNEGGDEGAGGLGEGGHGLEGDIGDEGSEGEGEEEVVDPFGNTRWREKVIEKIFVQPDCTSAKRQAPACDPWLSEERNKVGSRWRVGFCDIVTSVANPRASPPAEYLCKLRGIYVKLVAHSDEQERLTTWDLLRYYSGREASDFLSTDEGKIAKRDCKAWVGFVQDTLAEHIQQATCSLEPWQSAAGVMPMRYVARITWRGYPLAR